MTETLSKEKSLSSLTEGIRTAPATVSTVTVDG